MGRIIFKLWLERSAGSQRCTFTSSFRDIPGKSEVKGIMIGAAAGQVIR